MDRFFKDKHGKVVIWQMPNVLLWIWIVLIIAERLASHSRLGEGLSSLATVVLFCWAYLELTDGVNLFRRCLGAIVIGVITVGFFR